MQGTCPQARGLFQSTEHSTRASLPRFKLTDDLMACQRYADDIWCFWGYEAVPRQPVGSDCHDVLYGAQFSLVRKLLSAKVSTSNLALGRSSRTLLWAALQVTRIR